MKTSSEQRKKDAGQGSDQEKRGVSGIFEHQGFPGALEILLKHTEENIIVVDRSLNVVFCNEQFNKTYARLFGHPVVLGDSILKYTLPERRDALRQVLTDVLDGKPRETTIHLPIPDGGTTVFSNHFKPFNNDVGDLIGIFITSRDITEKLRREELVSAERNKLQRIMDQSAEIICTVRNGAFVTVSAAVEHILGFHPDELKGQQVAQLVHPDAEKEVEVIFDRLSSGGDQQKFELQCLHKLGHYVPLFWSANYGDKEDLVFAVARDASELKAAENQLKSSEIRLRNAQSMAELGNWECALDKKFISGSDKFCEIFEWNTPCEQVSMRKLITAIHPDDRIAFKQLLSSAREGQRTKSLMHRLALPGRRVKYVEHHIALIRDNIKGQYLLQGTVQDVSSRHRHALSQEIAAEVSKVLQQREDISTVLTGVLRLVGQFLGSEVGEAWLVDRDGNRLYRTATWSKLKKYKRFFTKSTKEFARGKGLPGYTARAAELQLWDKLQNRKRFIRVKQAARLGLDYGIGIPLKLDDRVLATFTLFGKGVVYDWSFAAEVIEDLTLKVALDIERRRTNEELELFFRYSPEINCLIGTDGYYRKVNPGFTELTGYSEKELTSRPFSSFLHPEDRFRSEQSLEGNKKGVLTRGFENRYIAKDGSIKWIRWHSSQKMDSEGYLLGFGTDITDLKESNLQLLRYQKIIENSKDVIGMVRLSDNKVFVNDAFIEQMGYTGEEVEALGGPPFLYPDISRGMEMFETISRGGYWKGDVQMRTKAGLDIDFFLSAGPIFDDNGSLIGLYGIHTDIRERKRIMRQLEESRKKYRDMFQYSPIPMFVYDTETLQFIDVNEAALSNYGYSKPEFLAMTIRDIRPEEELPALEKALASGNPGRSNHDHEVFVHHKKSGERIYVSVQRNNIDLDGRRAALVLATDVTEKTLIERELLYSEQRFKALVQNGAGVIAILDKEARFQYVSPNATIRLGSEPEDVLGELFFGYIHPKDRTRIRRIVSRGLKKKGQIELEPFRFRSKPEQDWRWISVVLTNMLDDPAVGGVVANARDITESILAERELKMSNERYDIVSRATSDTIWDWNLDAQTIIWNAGINKVFGYARADVIESEEWRNRRVHPDDFDRIEQKFLKTLKQRNENWQADYRFRCADGTYKYVNDRGFILYDDKQRATRIIGAMQDVTRERKEAEEREQVLRELTIHNNDLRQYSYITSHNLRAPLSNIIGLLNLIDEVPIADKKLSELLFGLSASARQLQETIDDLGQIIRIKNSTTVNKESIALDKAIRDVMAQLKTQLDKVQPEVKFDFSNAPIVYFSRVYLESIFQNLLTNALKYRSPERPLKISVRSSEEHNRIVVEFSDNGLGLDVERYKDRLFGLYQRFHTSPEGKGMGLFLVKSQMEALGGNIEIASKEGRGTKFRLIFADATD